MNLVCRLLWAATVLIALAVLWRGLWAGFYFEPTSAALAEARRGRVLVGVACLLLVAAAAVAVLAGGRPLPVAGGLLAPVVLCGGLTWLAPESLLPLLAVVLAYPAALAALVAGLAQKSG